MLDLFWGTYHIILHNIWLSTKKIFSTCEFFEPDWQYMTERPKPSAGPLILGALRSRLSTIVTFGIIYPCMDLGMATV